MTDQIEPEQPETVEKREESDGPPSGRNRTRTRRRARSTRSAPQSDVPTDQESEGSSNGRDGHRDRDDHVRDEPGSGARHDRSPDDATGEPTPAAATGDAGNGGAVDDDPANSEEGEGKRRRRRGRRGRGGKGRSGRGRGGDATADPSVDGPAQTAAPAAGDAAAADAAAAAAAGAGASTDDGAAADAAASDDAAGAGASTDADADADAAVADDSDGDRASTPTRTRRRERTSSTERGTNGSSRRASRRRSGEARADAEDDRTGTGRSEDDRSEKDRSEDEAVEAAIAKGGTRMAAKRGRRGTGSGRGGRQQRPGGVPEEVRRAILEGPPRTMLVTSREDRTQIAVLEDRTVVEHYVTRKEDVTYVGNIYMARVQNVLPGMEAAFLDIGKGRNGVLYAGEVLYDELDLEEGEDERIENALKPGQKVLVQVTKDPMGSKGPRLTMHLSLAGRYMVLAPHSDLFGISRKLTDRERDRLRKAVKQVKPSEHGVIVRTAAEGATDEQITADLERLLAKWRRVEEAAADAKALTTVYEEPPLVVKVIRDNFGPEFERCIVDDEDLYQQVRGYLGEVAPELLTKVELYGQPTTDARSKAVGAPSADGATAAEDAGTDATGESAEADDPAAGAGGEVAAADAGADRAAVERAGRAAETDDAPDRATPGSDEAGGDDGGRAEVASDVAAATRPAATRSSATRPAARTRTAMGPATRRTAARTAARPVLAGRLRTTPQRG